MDGSERMPSSVTGHRPFSSDGGKPTPKAVPSTLQQQKSLLGKVRIKRKRGRQPQTAHHFEAHTIDQAKLASIGRQERARFRHGGYRNQPTRPAQEERWFPEMRERPPCPAGFAEVQRSRQARSWCTREVSSWRSILSHDRLAATWLASSALRTARNAEVSTKMVMLQTPPPGSDHARPTDRQWRSGTVLPDRAPDHANQLGLAELL